MKRRHFLCAAAVLVMAAAAIFGQPPANDNFDNRTALTGSSVSFGGGLTNSTLEAGEPTLPLGSSGPNDGSIWWTWTAPTSSPVVISVLRDYSAGPSLNAALEVFSGTNFAQLHQMDYTSFQIPAFRYLKFAAVAGSNYQFRVSGHLYGSFAAQMTASSSPVIVRQPDSCTVSPYGSATFYVIAAGIPSPVYQWLFNGEPLGGQNAPILTVHNIQTNAAGSYSVVVSSSGGVTQSEPAVLSLTDTNPVPILTALPPTNSSKVPFLLRGEPGRWYKFEITDDLVNWYNAFLPFAMATNVSSTFSVMRTNQQMQFVRASLNAPTDACVAQLKAMSAALDLYALENKMSPMASYLLSDLKPYIKLDSPLNTLPVCPQYGTYWPGATITNPPSCSFYPIGHHLPW